MLEAVRLERLKAVPRTAGRVTSVCVARRTATPRRRSLTADPSGTLKGVRLGGLALQDVSLTGSRGSQVKS